MRQTLGTGRTVLMALAAPLLSTDVSATYGDDDKLAKGLFDDYNPGLLPTPNRSVVICVIFGFGVRQLLQLVRNLIGS